jgi:enoyl-[acyl-carrier-protein] reductase (NADH)
MEDIGRTASWLCSERAKNVTGQIISIDGGITLGRPPGE